MVIEFVIITLAVWRLTSAINRETIGGGIRKVLAGEKPDPVTPNEFTHSDTFLSHMITCFMCLSFWVSVFCVLAWVIYPPFLYPFAISTLVIYLEKVY